MLYGAAHSKIRRKECGRGGFGRRAVGGWRLRLARMGKRQKSIGGEGFQIVLLMGHWTKLPSELRTAWIMVVDIELNS